MSDLPGSVGSHDGPDRPGGGDTDPVANWETALRHTRFGPFEMVGTTGSTNDDLVARAPGPAGDGLVLATDHQTAGRGRLDRRWDAPEGTNLIFSTLLRPEWLAQPGPGPDCRTRTSLGEPGGVRLAADPGSDAQGPSRAGPGPA